jgi:predicted enzyme related to lactoylglutathione lyase
MSEQDRYIPGVPCWVDTTQPDPEAAADFYGELFGWEMEDVMPADAPVRYYIARLRGGDVAAVGSPAPGGPQTAAWNTYVWVSDADETAERVRDAGGTVLMEPADAGDFGRMAEFADPAGAAFRVWQAKEHRGAAIVNDPGSLNFNDLNTRDLEGARRFYSAVFGWEFGESAMPDMDYRMVRTGENQGGGLYESDKRDGHLTVYFETDDIDASVAKVRELGGQAEESQPIPGVGRFAHCTDPEGNEFSLFQSDESVGA